MKTPVKVITADPRSTTQYVALVDADGRQVNLTDRATMQEIADAVNAHDGLVAVRDAAEEVMIFCTGATAGERKSLDDLLAALAKGDA
jgi:hypothetical protein